MVYPHDEGGVADAFSCRGLRTNTLITHLGMQAGPRLVQSRVQSKLMIPGLLASRHLPGSTLMQSKRTGSLSYLSIALG